MTTTIPFKLTGQSLVSFVDERKALIERGELTRTEMVKDAGYMYDNGKAMWTEFYTELLNAKGFQPATMTDVNDAEYEELDPPTQKLYDLVDERFGEKWDHEQMMEFIELLGDIEITDVDTFDEYFYGVYDNEELFTEDYFNNIDAINENNPLYSYIDWQRVWDSELRYDFDTIEFDYEVYFFRNN